MLTPRFAWSASFLAQRTGQTACWASYRAESDAVEGTEATACIDRGHWLHWLASGSPLPTRFAPPLGTRYKSYSPPENGLGRHAKKIRVSYVLIPEKVPAHRAGLNQDYSAMERARKWIEKQREALSDFLREDPRRDRFGIFRHLFLNERMPEDPAGLLRVLGFIHVLTASGLHLYALAAFWSFIFMRLFRALEVPVRLALHISSVLVGASWLLAWALAGVPLGMLRPWLMISLRGLAGRVGFRWKVWAPLALALGLDLVFGLFRGQALHEGRIFYALAVGGGLLSSGGNHTALALGSWVFAAIWEGWKSGRVAILTPILSLLTIPFVSLLAYPGVFVQVLMQSLGSGRLTQHGVAYLLAVLNVGAAWMLAAALRLPAIFMVSRANLLSGAALASFALVLYTGLKKRRAVFSSKGAMAALFLLTLGGIPRLASLARAESPLAQADRRSFLYRVEQLDVGQGDSALVQGLSGQTGLIDTGSERRMSDLAWLDLLSTRRINRIDWIALTHLDEDHTGGVKRLAGLLPIGCVAISGEELKSERGQTYRTDLQKLGVPLATIESGACVPIPTLPPPAPNAKGGSAAKNGRGAKGGHGARSGHAANENMAAYLVPLQNGGYYLSAGDATRADEPRIARWAATFSKTLADGPHLIKVSHHGSKTSSAPEFFALTHPSEVWVSVGIGNTYGHPSAETLAELARLGVPIRRTDREGAISKR